jgi:hypothetical protein
MSKTLGRTGVINSGASAPNDPQIISGQVIDDRLACWLLRRDLALLAFRECYRVAQVQFDLSQQRVRSRPL